MQYIVLYNHVIPFDFDYFIIPHSSGQPEFLGYAPRNSSPSAAGWKIFKYYYNEDDWQIGMGSTVDGVTAVGYASHTYSNPTSFL